MDEFDLELERELEAAFGDGGWEVEASTSEPSTPSSAHKAEEDGAITPREGAVMDASRDGPATSSQVVAAVAPTSYTSTTAHSTHAGNSNAQHSSAATSTSYSSPNARGSSARLTNSRSSSARSCGGRGKGRNDQNTNSATNRSNFSSSAVLSSSYPSSKRLVATWTADALGVLPKEVWLRTLSFLSATDLTAAALVCGRLKDMCNEEFLWKRLYCHRWGGAAKGGVERNSWEQSWKASYMEKDEAELNDILNEVPCTMMQLAFKQMQMALRDYSFPDSRVDEILSDHSCQVRKEVAAWRAARGFACAKSHKPDLSKRGHYRFHKIGSDTFCCEETGWVHTCGEACKEKIVDRDSGLLVCPISGFTSDRMLTQWECEEACEAQPQAEEVGDDFGSRLARAFCEGYNCDDEKELQWRCGVKLT